MDQSLVAVAGPTAALVAALIAAGAALWNERRKRGQERELVELAAVRSRAADVFKEMFVLQHEVNWLTWHARHNAAAVDGRLLDGYESAVHACIPRLLGSRSVLASLDLELHEGMDKVARPLFALEAKVALQAARCRRPDERDLALAGLAALYKDASVLWNLLPTQMAHAMRARTAGSGAPAP